MGTFPNPIVKIWGSTQDFYRLQCLNLESSQLTFLNFKFQTISESGKAFLKIILFINQQEDTFRLATVGKILIAKWSERRYFLYITIYRWSRIQILTFLH